jgi:hypothetical protein
MWPVAFGSLLLLCVSVKVSYFYITFCCTVHCTAEGSHRVYNLWCCAYVHAHVVYSGVTQQSHQPLSQPCCHVLEWTSVGSSLHTTYATKTMQEVGNCTWQSFCCLISNWKCRVIQKDGLNFISLYFKIRTSDKYDVNYIWLYSQWSL